MHPIEEFLLEKIKTNPHDVIRLATAHFGITRAAIHRYMKRLKDKGLVFQKGGRNTAEYSLADNKSSLTGECKQFTYEVGKMEESEIWQRDIAPAIGELPQNLKLICEYGFTEMYNNVLDHSESKTANVVLYDHDDSLMVMIADRGVGVFKKIANACGFSDYREAAIKLHQGKFTTDSSKHSGEGIFFTSRVFDTFTISANGLIYLKRNGSDADWYIENRKEQEAEGTLVCLLLSKKATTSLQDIFAEYTNLENLKFEKSHIRISLAKFDEDQFISRSQAKRLLHGLHGFKEIILDFTNVSTVGQAFVDEVFIVFAKKNRDIKFIIANANENVLFMIKRGLATRDGDQLNLEFLK